ncbi:hypothetical protein FBU30_001822 [Linnemannia zychae]|nr:hypothetical protein FBU30_001822 [Linnemannia zychae]
MTSIASSKGDVGAEMLASQIGAYFDLAIRIIEFHGGDVVKFLGDALLVVFQHDPTPSRVTGSDSPSSPLLHDENPLTKLKRNKIIVRKAIDCGMELLARLSNYRIYLSEREYSRKLSASSLGVEDSELSEDENGTNPDSSISVAGSNANKLVDPRRLSHLRNSGSGLSQSNIKIGNIATGPDIKCGHLGSTESLGSKMGSMALVPTLPVLNIVPPGQDRNNNSIHAGESPLHPLGPGGVAKFRKREDSIVSTSTRDGSNASHRNRSFFSAAKNLFTHSNLSDRQSSPSNTDAAITEDAFRNYDDSHDLQLHMALSAGDITNIIIGDLGDRNAFDNILTHNTGRLEYAICGEHMASIDDALSMARAGEVTITKRAWKYVNPDSYPWSEPRKNCFILRNNQPNDCQDTPLLRKVRNNELLNAYGDISPNYFMFINKSAIHRLILYPDSNFPAQFRNATILFISLGDVKPWRSDGLSLCQKAMVIVHKVTSAYEGFIQQFAVDDKGATLLCAFGLPYPRSHEKEALFAAKSAWIIRQEFLEQAIFGFKISLATGVIFTSMIGNEFRRDPAIVGDTIVVAVRILNFDYAKESIVLDDATKQACSNDNDGLCEFEDRGDEFVKGKTYPIRVWRLIHFGAKKQIRRPIDVTVDENIGYGPEREKVSNYVAAWAKSPDHNTILITGPRGSGKRMFYHQMIHIADSKGYRICSAASAEVEKKTEYYLVKFLLLGLFDIIRQRDIPYSSKISTLQTIDGDTSSEEILPDPVTINTAPVIIIEEEFTLPSTVSPKLQVTSDSEESEMPTIPSYHLDERRSSNISVDLSISPTISQYGEPSACRSQSMTKLEAYICVCLTKMGEYETGLLPQLNEIITSISCDNATPILSESDDKILTDFIVDVLNYMSQFVKIIVMFEDIQWCDSKSLATYRCIHARCRDVLMVLFSRPQRDYGCNEALQAIFNNPHHLEISLEGLKRREIELALINAFKANGVTKVSPDVVEMVQQRTKGNPKLVKSMATILKDFYHVNIVDGELLSTGQEVTADTTKVMEEMVVKQDRKRTVLMQYDRLRPRFQDFLKIASCLGDRFSLAEIAAIRPLDHFLGAPEPGKTYANIISDQDTYRFLSMATDQQTNIHFSNSLVLQTIYTFSSPSTASDIYNSIPYEERVGYHLKMGQFYESFLLSGYGEDLTDLPLNGQDLLPKITHHYMKTEYTEKKVKYLIALSRFDLKSNMLTSSTENVNRLIDILDNVPGAREMVSQEDLADIYGIKGESLSKRMRIEEAEPALIESLAYYGILWPQTKQEWKSTILRESLKFKFYHLRGESPVKVKNGHNEPRAKVGRKEKMRYQRILRVLYCLQNIYFWMSHPNAAMLSSLYTLKYSRKLGVPSGVQAASLGRIGLLLYFQDKKRLCDKYMSESWIISNAGLTTEGMLPAMSAYIEYSEGHIEDAHQLLTQAIQESKTFGVVTHLASFYRAVTMKCVYRMWEGTYNMHPEDCQLLRTLSAVAMQNGDSEGETLFAIPTLSNLLLLDRLREAESWAVLIEKFIMPKARLMNLLIVHAILAYYYSRIGQYDKSRFYLELFGDVIGIPVGGAHPFPMMSCMFSLMSMYEMYENEHVHEQDASRSVFLHSRGTIIIDRILRYINTDPKDAPITKAYRYLGEALRFFLSPGHEKEGAQKLTLGYQDLAKHLDGLHLVKAYYLARISRYGSDPSMKEVYYNEAHALFDGMLMDSSVWLNTFKPSSFPPPPPLAPLSAGVEDPDMQLSQFVTSDMLNRNQSTESLDGPSAGWSTPEYNVEAKIGPLQPVNQNSYGSTGLLQPGMENNQSRGYPERQLEDKVLPDGISTVSVSPLHLGESTIVIWSNDVETELQPPMSASPLTQPPVIASLQPSTLLQVPPPIISMPSSSTSVMETLSTSVPGPPPEIVPEYVSKSASEPSPSSIVVSLSNSNDIAPKSSLFDSAPESLPARASLPPPSPLQAPVSLTLASVPKPVPALFLTPETSSSTLESAPPLAQSPVRVPDDVEASSTSEAALHSQNEITAHERAMDSKFAPGTRTTNITMPDVNNGAVNPTEIEFNRQANQREAM